MPSCLRRRRASANGSCRTAGTEIWSDSIAKVGMLMWSHLPASYVTTARRGRCASTNPSPALPLRASANESQSSHHCQYEQPHDVHSPSPVSERRGMACNRPAGTRALQHIHPRVPGPRHPAFVCVVLLTQRVLPCEQPESRAILWRRCLISLVLRKSASPASPPVLHTLVVVVSTIREHCPMNGRPLSLDCVN